MSSLGNSLGKPPEGIFILSVRKELAIMLTRESVISAWKANGWKDLTVTCPDGAEAVLSPCGTGPVIKTEADIEYVLVFCDIPYVGGALDYVINTLNDHAGRLAKLERERARLAAAVSFSCSDIGAATSPWPPDGITTKSITSRKGFLS